MVENPTVSDRGSAVEFDSAVLQQIRRHARSSMAAEICGVLIGELADGVTRVDGCIAGEKAKEAGAHVTFTQETWQHIYKIKDTKFADASIVGWYHSHPGFGIFLSDYDLFIHKNFFTAPHQVAWVFDPHSDEEGCFGWVSGEIAPIKRISVLRQATEFYPKVTEVTPAVRSIDTAVTRIKRTRLSLVTFKKWALYVAALMILVVAAALYQYKTAHKVPRPRSLASAQRDTQALSKWREREEQTMTKQLLSPTVKEFFANRSQLLTSIGFEVKNVRPTTISGKEDPAQNDEHIRNVEYVIRYKWGGWNEDAGWMDVTYVYDRRRHHVTTIQCGKFNIDKGVSRSEYQNESCSIAKEVKDLLFKEK